MPASPTPRPTAVDEFYPGTLTRNGPQHESGSAECTDRQVQASTGGNAHRALSIQRGIDAQRSFGNMTSSNLLDQFLHTFVFQEQREEALRRLLFAASEVLAEGYSQGMNYIAAVLLLDVDEEAEAFAVLAYLLRERALEALYMDHGRGLQSFCSDFDTLVRQRLPELHSFLLDRNVSTAFYAVEWFPTLFSKSCHPDLVRLCFDLFLALDPAEDRNVLIHVGLALLGAANSRLFALSGEEELLTSFRKIIRELDPLEVMQRAVAALLGKPLRSTHGGGGGQEQSSTPQSPSEAQERRRNSSNQLAALREESTSFLVALREELLDRRSLRRGHEGAV
mmetsp:Transcript_4983/g.14827  ORF Transcript_4983/g.14827 Transcript_4983/m.14827 type:complete len:337 (-) Transcript_4983:225-1235(-)|eukprot:CAMPEP_0118970032 /NCGR_PEP_ID=MMETSP1173-20130426/7013_1 /TAXON_ID=1034831 /ORGANISM="Rhizochromulina marina cf, Strain CCMP1243" /LENGTH=336 /DNA_ID=CAMNT_0006919341 /DNA_START=289 /DNA_END=1299 /DNA_ORIENTATION=-